MAAPKDEVVYLNAEAMELVIHQLTAQYFAQFDEPIPDFATHNHHLLESALALPQATFGGKDLYPSVAAKGSVMFYSLIKNHPFSNGNKRLATTALLVFFYLNDFWLDSEQKGVYTWAVRIAESKRSEQTAVVRQMTKWLHKKLVDRHAATARAGLFGRVWRALNLLVPGRHWFRRRQK